MSDFFDKNTEEQKTAADSNVGEPENVTEQSDEEESTVFSAPLEHNDKAPKNPNKKRLTAIISACVAVAVLICGTIGIVKLIPELEDDEAVSSVFEDISVLDKDSSTFKTVTVTNSNGSFNFVTQQITATNEDGEEETTDYWCVEGVDISKLSSNTMTSIISSAASVTATREITTKTASDCGFDNPTVKVSVEDDTNGSFAFLIGDESPDGLGSYFMLEGSDKIYVVASSEFSAFEFELLDLSDKSSIPATVFNTDTSANETEDGSYAYFDSLTLSGKLYPETITIENNKQDNASAEVIPYLITTPMKRYANSDSLSSLVNLFSSEINVSGNYAFDINDQTLKEFGLDNPDAVVTMTINGESKTFKISNVESGYCAVIYDGATMIRKITSSSFAFLSLSTEDYYNKMPFMYSINDVAVLELDDNGEKIKFDISYTEDDDSNKTYTVSANGTQIDAPAFQTFYADFVSTQCSDFTVENVSRQPEGSITFTFNDGAVASVKFYKVNETQYQYSVDDIQMGRITSAAYKKIVRNIKTQTNAE